MKRLRSPAVVALSGMAIVSLLWLTSPHLRFHLNTHRSNSVESILDSAEVRLNQIYRDTRPFPYRWVGAPYSAPSPKQVNQGMVEDVLADIERADSSSGRNARSLRLKGRSQLLFGHYSDAISDYHSSLLLDPDNTDSTLELGVAYALRAGTGASALDYEFALERILKIARRIQSPETVYDAALIMAQIPLPYQAVKQWEVVIMIDSSPNWRDEAKSRLAALRQHIELRDRLNEDISSSPESYLLHEAAVGKSVEVVLGAAVEEWLPKAHISESTRHAIARLADTLRTEYHDAWLGDLTVEHRSAVALTALAEASAANARGEHIRAELSAIRAEQLFSHLQNQAGVLRSRLERVYSLDRRERAAECIGVLTGLRSAAQRKSYIWIAGQAWLEEVTCRSETRSNDVAASRQQAYEWIRATRYEGLHLRALSFLTEAYASFDHRLQIWRIGLEGLQRFWNASLPPLRGYTFYYTLARSAESAGDSNSAIWLLREGVEILNHSPHRHILALVLSDLGAWERALGLQDEAQHSFSQMEDIFANLDPMERQKFWREAEITHAEAELGAGESREALFRLQKLTVGLTFPYPAFSPTARRRLLVLLGNIHLALGDVGKASADYTQAVSEVQRKLDHVTDRSQRDNTLRELETAWRGLTEIQIRRGVPAKALELWESFRCGRVDMAGWHSEQSQETIRKQLQHEDGTAFLIYAFLPGGLSAWLLSSRGAVHGWADAKAVAHEAQLFSTLASDSESPLITVEASSRRLYNLLVQPFANRLPTQGILIIDADGPLAGIPWSALEDQAGRVLLEHFAISQVSGWIEASRNGPSETLRKAPLIIGQPLLGPELAREFPRLPGPSAAAHQLHDLLPNSQFFEGPDATTGSVLNHLQDSTLFYFAGHGVGYGEFGGLLLAASHGDPRPAAFLTADQVRGLKLSKLDLVVLAACSSGAGEQDGAVNLDSLVRAFLESGVTRVVASRWNVSSGQTEDLMGQFYDLTLRQTRPAEALRQAELKIHRVYLHPYYWAGFQVFGNP